MQWLINAQKDTGEWDPKQWGGYRQYTIGLTGLALLSVAKTDGEHSRDSIDRASKYLIGQQKENGQFGEAFGGTMYNHGIATVALLDAYKSTQSPELVKPIQRALDYIKDKQLNTGGWGYENTASESANTSISTWPLQALLQASRVDWKDETHALQHSLRWLTSVIDSNGQFGYQRTQQFPRGPDALTAMGAYCVLRAANEGVKIDSSIIGRIESGLHNLNQKKNSKMDFYRTYFRICALKEVHADKWVAALDSLQDDIVCKIEPDGPHKGSWTPEDQWGPVGGRVYSTALASLALHQH